MNSSKNYYRQEGYNWQTNSDELFEEAWRDIFEKSVAGLGLIKENDKVLDVGCGKGAIVPYLPKCDYVGIDISESNIRIASEKYPDRKFSIGDATALVFPDGEFDCIICVETLEHLTIEEMKRTLDEMKRVGKKGCRIVITVPNLYWLWGLIPWSLFPLRRRLNFRKFFIGLRNGYVNENLSGLEASHYRFKPSFLKEVLAAYFVIRRISTTFWYNNRAIHKRCPRFQLKIMKFSRKHSFFGLKVGGVLVVELTNEL